jgi:hypothetical protein
MKQLETGIMKRPLYKDKDTLHFVQNHFILKCVNKTLSDEVLDSVRGALICDVSGVH